MIKLIVYQFTLNLEKKTDKNAVCRKSEVLITGLWLQL